MYLKLMALFIISIFSFSQDLEKTESKKSAQERYEKNQAKRQKTNKKSVFLLCEKNVERIKESNCKTHTLSALKAKRILTVDNLDLDCKGSLIKAVIGYKECLKDSFGRSNIDVLEAKSSLYDILNSRSFGLTDPSRDH